jgi:lipopolysaccharide/colanic/teichoic acid biosynthesis glycosyltransferase
VGRAYAETQLYEAVGTTCPSPDRINKGLQRQLERTEDFGVLSLIGTTALTVAVTIALLIGLDSDGPAIFEAHGIAVGRRQLIRSILIIGRCG